MDIILSDGWTVGERRHEKDLRRNRRKEKRLYRKRNSRHYQTKSRVLNMLYAASKIEIPIKRRFVNVDIPNPFSIIESPTTTLRTIFGFSTAIRKQPLTELYIDHSRMQSFDLAAEAILDLIAEEFETEKRRMGRRKTKIGGRYPKDPNVSRFVRAIGIIRSLQIKHEMLLPQLLLGADSALRY